MSLTAPVTTWPATGSVEHTPTGWVAAGASAVVVAGGGISVIVVEDAQATMHPAAATAPATAAILMPVRIA